MNQYFSHHRVEIDGMRQHYLLAGSGDPVVLLHGFPETSYAWRKIIPALAEDYTVVAPRPARLRGTRTVPLAATTNGRSQETLTA